MYEVFDHTADLGLRITAGSFPELLSEAGRGLCSVLVENIEAVQPVREVTIRIPGTASDYLLFDWLTELLYRYESEGLLLVDFSPAVDDEGVTVVARGETVDGERHQRTHEVKAVTYHLLEVSETAAGWEAAVILDI